jgi:hypothetical protein
MDAALPEAGLTVPGVGWASLAVPSVYSKSNFTVSTHALNCSIEGPTRE